MALRSYISFQYLSGHVNSRLGRYEERRWRPVQEGVCLNVHIYFFHAVTEFFEIKLCLNGNVFPAFDRFGRVSFELLFGASSGKSTTSFLLLLLYFDRIWLSRLEQFGKESQEQLE